MTCFIEITFYEDLKKFLLIYSLIPCYLLFLKKKTTTTTNNKQPTKTSISKRIRVVHHPLQVNLLIAVWTRLLFTHNAPATDAELVESVGSGLS